MIEEIWTEKYRPKKLDEIIGQEHVTKRLEAFVEKKSLPHCLFTGPAGVGKTTAAVCIARASFGNQWSGNFLELNSSDERGIETIRVKVKDFARTLSMSGGFKIIYLDEADALTRDAQHALRRTMEKYTDTARFILSCNYSSKIIDPIQSRTAVFRFSSLKEEEIRKYLEKIAENEKLDIDEDALDALIYVSEGDMRKATNIIQTAAIDGSKITKDVVFSVTSGADPDAVKKMIRNALSGDFKEARKLLLDMMTEKGMSGEDIIRGIHRQVINEDMDEKKRMALLEKVGEYEFRITEGSNSRIQLEALLAQMGLVGME